MESSRALTPRSRNGWNCLLPSQVICGRAGGPLEQILRRSTAGYCSTWPFQESRRVNRRLLFFLRLFESMNDGRGQFLHGKSPLIVVVDDLPPELRDTVYQAIQIFLQPIIELQVIPNFDF